MRLLSENFSHYPIEAVVQWQEMRIYKYLHSCLVIEENGKRLLIDPGAFSFVEGMLKPQDIGPVDAILLTHQHLDHYYPDALKIILALHSAPIFTNAEIAALAKQQGIDCHVMNPGEIREVEGFIIEAFQAPHGAVPAAIPENTAFRINKKILHSGDSIEVPFEAVRGTEVLALPVAAPWSRLVDVIAFAHAIQPKIAIPVHDAILKDFMLERVYAMCKAKLEEQGIAFRPLASTAEFVET